MQRVRWHAVRFQVREAVRERPVRQRLAVDGIRPLKHLHTRVRTLAAAATWMMPAEAPVVGS